MPSDRASATTRPSVSVIVPAYNVEDWLDQCLSSVVAQSFADWECIVVIDGSPDGSEAIAKQWSQRDERIRVVSVANGGLGSARNIGLGRATGDWIFFLDSDDELPERALELLRDAGDADQADVVMGVGVDFFPDGRQTTYWTQNSSLHRTRSWGHTVESTPQVLTDHVAWSKLFRRDLLADTTIRFSTGVHCEDLVFSVKVLAASAAISVIPEVVYRHRRHDQAISADYLRDKTLVDWMGESERAIQFLQAHSSAEVVHYYLDNFVRRQWWTRAEKFERIGSSELVAEFERFTRLLLGALEPTVFEQLPPLVRSSMRFVADSGLTRRWSRERLSANPLARPGDSGVLAAETALEAIQQLDLAEESDAALAASLMVARVGFSIMRDRRHGRDTRELESRMFEVASGLSAEDLLSHLGNGDDGDEFDPSGSPTRALSRVLLRLEPVQAILASAHVTAQTVTLRGSVRLGLAHPPLSRMWLVLRSQTSARVRVFPTWWNENAGDGTLVWSIPIHLTDDLLDQQWKCWIRLQRDDHPPRDIALENHLDDASWHRRSPGGDSSSCTEVVFARSRVALWRADRLPEGAEPEVLGGGSVPSTGVFTFPNWNGNPYLMLLQLEARARGRDMSGSTDVAALVAELTDGDSSRIVHIHWTSPITEGASDDADAMQRARLVIDAVRQAVARGRHVIWTVHNTLPHDARFPEAARLLHRGLAEVVPLVHSLSHVTADAVSDEFALPRDREIVIPHSSFYGVYGSRIPRSEALAALGAPEHETSVLFLGQIRPYKGLEHLLAAVQHLSESPQAGAFQLLVAGKPSPEAAQVLQALDQARFSTTVALRFVTDDEISTWLSAADVLVAPYRAILNSGTLHLAATFGVPTVLPDLPHLRRQFDGEPWVRFFDPDDAAASIATALGERFFEDERVRRAALDFGRRYLPSEMARDYADTLDALESASR